MPTASIVTATAVNPGFLTRVRKLNRMSPSTDIWCLDAERRQRLPIKNSGSELAVDRPHRLLQAAAPDDDRDGQLAGPLGDRDDVDVVPRNRSKEPAGETRRAAHALAHYRDQADVGVHFDGLEVAVDQLKPIEVEADVGLIAVV